MLCPQGRPPHLLLSHISVSLQAGPVVNGPFLQTDLFMFFASIPSCKSWVCFFPVSPASLQIKPHAAVSTHSLGMQRSATALVPILKAHSTCVMEVISIKEMVYKKMLVTGVQFQGKKLFSSLMSGISEEEQTN